MKWDEQVYLAELREQSRGARYPALIAFLWTAGCLILGYQLGAARQARIDTEIMYQIDSLQREEAEKPRPTIILGEDRGEVWL